MTQHVQTDAQIAVLVLYLLSILSQHLLLLLEAFHVFLAQVHVLCLVLTAVAVLPHRQAVLVVALRVWANAVAVQEHVLEPQQDFSLQERHVTVVTLLARVSADRIVLLLASQLVLACAVVVKALAIILAQQSVSENAMAIV